MGKGKPTHVPIFRSRIRYSLSESKPSRPALFFLRLLHPFYRRMVLNITSISIRKPEALVAHWRDFQEKKTRLIIAFRHPYGDEPQLFSLAFAGILHREARRLHTSLLRRPHARFVHGYEVALWGGSLIRWLLPRIGAVPVYHVKTDTAGINAIRTILRDDDYPLALAPEGQVSYRSETVPRLEQGAAQLGFWCARDIERAGRTEQVVILPLSVHHRFDPRDTKKLLTLVGKLERKCGLETHDAGTGTLRERLFSLEERILSLAEEHYKATCGFVPPPPGIHSADARREALMEAALTFAEKMLGIGVENPDLITRVYTIRQLCWDRIYPEKMARNGCELAEALAHRRAGEAWYAMRHMEFVDLAFYLDRDYLADNNGAGPSFDRLAETVYNLDDLVSRLSGGNITDRTRTIRKKAVIIAGTALDLSARLPDYAADRKKAVKAATEDLNTSFLDCIKEYIHGNAP